MPKRPRNGEFESTKAALRRAVKRRMGSRYARKTAAAQYGINYLRRAAMNRRTGGFLGIESKFYDTSLNDGALTAPADASGGEHDPTVDCLNAPAQGNSEQQRIGRSIRVTRCSVMGYIHAAALVTQTAVAAFPNFFVAIVLDTQANATTLNSEDVYKNQAADADLATMPLRNMSNTGRFRVLAQRHLRVSTGSAANNAAATTVSCSGFTIPFQFHLRMNMPVRFKVGSTAAGIASVEDNAIHVIAYTNSTVYTPKISYQARVRYTDV